MDGCAGGIQTKDTKHQTKQSNANIENGKKDLTGRGKPLAPVQVQPVNTGQTVAEPGGEQRTDQTVEVTEDRDGLGNDPGDNPAGNSETEPEADRALVLLVHQTGVGAETEVDVLQPDVAVDDTGADDGRDGDTVGDLAH